MEKLSIEDALERFIFASRWLLAIFYVGLIGCLFVLAARFVEEFGLFAFHSLSVHETKFLLDILHLVDLTLLANLLPIIIFSGYENFVSIIGVAQKSPDRPKWMGGIDFAFLEISHTDKTDLDWMIGVHLVFVVTGVLFALSEKIMHGSHHS